MVWRFSSRFPPLVEERQGSSSPEILIARQQLKSTYQDDYYTRKRGVCVNCCVTQGTCWLVQPLLCHKLRELNYTTSPLYVLHRCCASVTHPAATQYDSVLSGVHQKILSIRKENPCTVKTD